jgi:hypothetical protein
MAPRNALSLILSAPQMDWTSAWVLNRWSTSVSSFLHQRASAPDRTDPVRYTVSACGAWILSRIRTFRTSPHVFQNSNNMLLTCYLLNVINIWVYNTALPLLISALLSVPRLEYLEPPLMENRLIPLLYDISKVSGICRTLPVYPRFPPFPILHTLHLKQDMPSLRSGRSADRGVFEGN